MSSAKLSNLSHQLSKLQLKLAEMTAAKNFWYRCARLGLAATEIRNLESPAQLAAIEEQKADVVKAFEDALLS